MRRLLTSLFSTFLLGFGTNLQESPKEHSGYVELYSHECNGVYNRIAIVPAPDVAIVGDIYNHVTRASVEERAAQNGLETIKSDDCKMVLANYKN